MEEKCRIDDCAHRVNDNANGCLVKSFTGRCEKHGGKSSGWYRPISNKPIKRKEEEMAETEVDIDDIHEDVCDFCRSHFETSSHCEGSGPCDEALDMYLEDNNLTLKQEDKMGKTIIDKDVKAEFGKEEGDTLINVSDHLDDAMIRRYVMKANHKEIAKECNDIEKKRLEDCENKQ